MNYVAFPQQHCQSALLTWVTLRLGLVHTQASLGRLTREDGYPHSSSSFPTTDHFSIAPHTTFSPLSNLTFTPNTSPRLNLSRTSSATFLIFFFTSSHIGSRPQPISFKNFHCLPTSLPPPCLYSHSNLVNRECFLLFRCHLHYILISQILLTME